MMRNGFGVGNGGWWLLAMLVVLSLLSGWGTVAMAETLNIAPDPGEPATASQPAPIPLAELGQRADAQQAAPAPILDGDRAILTAPLQALRGEIGPEGLSVDSTSASEGEGRFRLTPVALSKGGTPTPVQPGVVRVQDQTAILDRGQLREVFTASADGLRQDFVVAQPPAGDAPLTLTLALDGATASEAASGVALTLPGGRQLVYHRLQITDADGQTLTGQLRRQDDRTLAITVQDAHARYPLTIDPTITDADWQVWNPGLPGANGSVDAITYDALNSTLYVGGAFTAIGTVLANYIAKWDGAHWLPLGTGMDNTVNALAVDGSGKLYAGGFFTTAGGTSASYIAQWNGTTWAPLDTGMDSPVRALAVDGSGRLYVGGDFLFAGGISANYIAEWNISTDTWSPLDTGMDNSVFALAVDGSGTLYVGGYFTAVQGGTAGTLNYIAKWDGTNWSPLGTGMNNPVFALATDGHLYAGGAFTTAGGISANYIAEWNIFTDTWSALDSGMNAEVRALATLSGDLYAGGAFTTAGGVTANYIATWNVDSSLWLTYLGSGMNGPVTALASDSSGNVYFGGDFTTAGGSPANRIAKYNVGTWSALSGPNNTVLALAADGNNNLYVGGSFTSVGWTSARYIAKWDGSAWSALGSGTDDTVRALAVSGNTLYAGGAFIDAGGIGTYYIAQWDTITSTWSPVGFGMNGQVYALAVSGGTLYAGGEFTTVRFGTAGTLNRIAKWNTATSAWSALGSPSNGTDGVVLALAVDGNNNLYAGGTFATAGATSASNIAQWNTATSAWSALDSGLDNTVFALAVDGTTLYAGGNFTTAGGTTANYIAQWNTTTSAWSALGTGMNGSAHALAVSGATLYVGGIFTTTADGSAANRIAQWNTITSAWSALGSGTDHGVVAALAVSGGNLYVGGDFTTAGGKSSPYAAYVDLPVPVLTPATQTVTGQVGTALTTTAYTPSGFSGPVTYNTISPALPADLILDSATGVISGTPTATQVATTYTVTGTDAASATATATISITVVAAPTYTVTYNGNGATGSVPIDSGSYTTGQTVIVRGNTGGLVKTGFTFAGWNTQADGLGTPYAAGSTFVMGSANVTLYAQWAAVGTYTVTYDANGATGSVPIDSGSYTTGQTVIVLGNTGGLVKTGFSFAGWNTQADGLGTPYAAGSTFTMGSSNIILYAQWTLIPTYTVTATAVGPGGVISPATQAVSSGSTTTFTVASPGHTPTMGGTCPLGALVGNTYTTGTITANCTVTATFSLDSYAIIVSGSGSNGIVFPTSGNIAYTETTTFTVTPSTGYTAMVTGCGGSLVGNLYITGPIIESCAISAQFIPDGATRTVTNTNDNGPGSLRQAILNANSTAGPNRITFQNGLTGTILTGGTLTITDDVLIEGTGGVTVDGQNNTQILMINSGKKVVINGLNFKRGKSPALDGGGAINNGGTLTVRNSDFTNNNVQDQANHHGGAILGNIVTVVDSTFSGNNGSAIVTWGGLTVLRSTLDGNHNTADGGGAIYATTQHPNVVVAGSTLSNNTARNSGGGMAGYGKVTVIDSTFSGNQMVGHGDGGGLQSYDTKVIINSTFTNNRTVCPEGTYWCDGGAISRGQTIVTNSTFSGNSTTGDGSGGAFYVDTLRLTNSTVTGNNGDWDKGGIRAVTLFISNSIVAGNTRTTNIPDEIGAGTILSQGYNLIGVNSTPGISSTSSNFPSTGDLTATVPITAVLDPLGNNGGPTQTHGLAGGSPAIDTGNSALVPAGITTDQRGAPREVNGTVDRGAVESSSTVQYTVYAAGGPNGTITDLASQPVNSQTVNTGATLSFLVNPIGGYTATVTGCGGTLVGAAYTTGAITADCTVIATFTTQPTYTVIPSAGANGTISPNTPQTVNHGATTTFTVTPNAGYTASVTGCGGSLSGNLYTTGPITAACTVNATFGQNSYLVTATAGAGGTIDPPSQTIAYGGIASFTVTPDPGFTAAVTGCGGSLSGNLYTTGPITAACTVNATFGQNSYLVTATAGAGGTIDPLTQTIAYGGIASFTITPAAGFTAAVTGCGGTLTGNLYTTGPITATCTVNTTFGQDSHLVTATAGAGGTIDPTSQTIPYGGTASFTVTPASGYTAAVTGCGGSLSGNLYTTGPITAACTVNATFGQNSYLVTATAGAGGTIDPLTQTIAYGGIASFTITPAAGYTASVTGCGGSLSGNLYTTGPITATCTVNATFGQDSYLVTATAGSNGTIDPPSQTIPYGGTASFTVTPNPGYTAAVTGCGGTLTGNLYTTGPITAACTVSASFGQDSYLVTATAGSNGTIDPTSQTIPYGGTANFTVTPNAGYTAAVTGCGGSLTGNLYTTGPITADCTVIATFSTQPALSINDVRQAKGSSGITPFTFTVTLSSAASQPVTVAWATADGTARAGRDYTAASGSLSFAVGGALSQTLTVEVLGGAPSPDQTFFVRLSAPVNATLARIEGIGTILSLAPPAAAGLIWTGDQFIAVSIGGQIHTSPDGFTWTAQNSGTTQNLNSVAGSGRQFVAVGSAGTILTSPDGIGWTPLTLAVTADLNGVAWSGSQFVAVGNGVILTSADGVTWTAQTAGNLYAVTWAGSQWVAVGAGGTILTSSDGFTWTAGSSGTAQDLRSVAWAGTQLVAVGSGGVILTSPNGNAWTARASGTPQDLSGIAWSGSQFLAGGTGGVLLASPDGIAWTPQAAGTPEDLYSIAWAGDRWLAVGANATRIALARTWGDLKPLILNRWTMLSLPGIPGTATASTALAGLDPAAYLTEWSVYDYDLATREYRQLPPTAPLSQTSGYWIIDQGSVAHTVQLTAPATATPVGFGAGCSSTRGCYEIPLRAPSGTDAHLFHLVGMPFPYPVGWWEVRLEVDGTAIPLDDARNVYVAPGYWVWNGNDYDTHDSATPGSAGLLQPWQGIWVKVLAAGQGHTLKLLIPRLPKYSHVPTPARPIPGWQKALDWLIPAAAAAESDRRWYVRLIAEEATVPMQTRNSVLGQLPDSVEGYDAHDLPKMAPFAAPYLSIAFPQPAWGTRADDYATDYRPSGAARLPPATWRFEVRTDRAGYAVTLRWEGPPDLLGRMELVDEDTGRRYPASDPGVLRNGVPLTMTAPVRHFTWIFAGQPSP